MCGQCEARRASCTAYHCSKTIKWNRCRHPRISHVHPALCPFDRPTGARRQDGQSRLFVRQQASGLLASSSPGSSWAHLLRGTPHARPSIAPNLAPRTSRCHDSTRVSHDSSPATDSLGILSVILVRSLVPGCPVMAAGPRAPARRLSGAVRGRLRSDALRQPMRAGRSRLSHSAVPHTLASQFGLWPSAGARSPARVRMQRPIAGAQRPE